MAYLLLCIKEDTTLLDHAIFSRDLAHVHFEKSLGLALRTDPCTGSTQYFLIRFLQEKFKENLTKAIRKSGQNDRNSAVAWSELYKKETKYCKVTVDSVTEQFASALSFVDVNLSYRTRISLPSDVALCTFQETVKSSIFRQGFVSYVRKKAKFHDVRDTVCMCDEVNKFCDVSISIPCLIEVCVLPPVVTVCYAWCYRIGGLVTKRLILDETMAWLSTLGGGYSSLGDHFQYHSKEAGRISVTQFKIAMEMGDPIMASKCRLFFALSQLQRGYLRVAKKMIRKEYELAVQMQPRDVKLLDMCRGVWSKLQYAYYQRKQQKLTLALNGCLDYAGNGYLS